MSTRRFSGLVLFAVLLLGFYSFFQWRPQVLNTWTPLEEQNDLYSVNPPVQNVYSSANQHKLLQYHTSSSTSSDITSSPSHTQDHTTLFNTTEPEVYITTAMKRDVLSNEHYATLKSDVQHYSSNTDVHSKNSQNNFRDTSNTSNNQPTFQKTQETVSSTATTDLNHYISATQSPTHDHCDVSGKSWKRGIITQLRPRIEANCELLIHNDRREVNKVKRDISLWRSQESEEEWIESLSDCEKVVEDFSNNFYNSPEEIAFPLAYVLVVYTNPRQMVRLIKALWRPQNLFCVHPDAKQSDEFIGVFRQLSKCLGNIFLPRKLEKVYYQHHSIMDSQMNCYEDLLRYPSSTSWKYVINLCGRELPLKTNREMVKSLKALKGSSAIETQHVNTKSKGYLAKDRFTWKAKEDYSVRKLHYTRTRVSKPPIPIYKSTNFIAVTRPFVNFFVNDKKAVIFREYLNDIKIPEEEFYASLIHVHGVPGGLPPHKLPLPTIDKYIWMNKYKQTRSKYESCEGKMVHFICIVGVGDLDEIFHLGVNRKRPVFFFNKYFMEEDHVVMDCMEERLLHQNMKEHQIDCMGKH